MASFVIHHIVGERVLSLLEQEYDVKLSEKQKKKFLLGNLITDSSKIKFEVRNGETPEEAKRRYSAEIQKEKVFTHFRSENDSNLCIQVPVCEKFIEKYSDLLGNDLSALGYLLHLYTDRTFFRELFLATFDTLDDNLNSTIYLNEATKIRVKKDGKIYSTNEFWGTKGAGSVYDDYTIMNKMLLEYYNVKFDKDRFFESVEDFVNPGIEEVDYANIVSVINKTDGFIRESYERIDSPLCVFSEGHVLQFIDEVVGRFINGYANQIKLLCVEEEPNKLIKER